MEFNEEIEALKGETDLKKKLDVINHEIDSLTQTLDILFKDEKFAEAKECLDKIRYMNRSREYIHKKLNELQ